MRVFPEAILAKSDGLWYNIIDMKKKAVSVAAKDEEDQCS